MHSPANSTARTHKRIDLQGVRALAVLLVAINHGNLHVLSGGYVGVDVFFVLSGFFITGLLLREGAAKLGGPARAKISLSDFYTRRMRRILPAAALTIVVTSVAVYVVYDLMHRDYLNTKPTLMDGLAATLFYANIHFAANSTDYFTASANSLPSPFQHFWSLSVEEQFYFVWPAALLGVYALADRLGSHRPAVARTHARWLTGGLLAVVFAASLYWSWHYTHVNPAAAYFITFTRIWELALGALVALAFAEFGRLGRQPAALRWALGLVGLAAIAYASVKFTQTTPFPGLAALVPTLGTVALIIAGHGIAQTVGVNRLLATAPMAFVGDRSYSFYLWHFPALIITWTAVGHYTKPGVTLLILAGAFALSCLTYALFENPIRRAQRIRGWRMIPVSVGFLGASTASVLVFAALFTASLSTGTGEATAAQQLASAAVLKAAPGQPVPPSLADPKPIPALQKAIGQVQAGASIPSYFPTVATLNDGPIVREDLPAGCLPGFGPHATSNVCHLGDTKSKQVIVLAGDSHAEMWDTMLIKLADELHFQVVVLAKPGCFIARDLGQETVPSWPCKQWYQWMLAQDKALRPVATLLDFISANYENRQAKIYVDDVFRVTAQTVNPVVIADTPNLQSTGNQFIYEADCLSNADATMASCAGQLPAWYPQMLTTLQAQAKRAKVPTIATLQWVCGDGVCPPVINHTAVFRDDTHLSAAYSAQLAPLFKPELQAALKQLANR